MSNNWTTQVISNFENAAHSYNGNAKLQRMMALELAQKCAEQKIPAGMWVDLGAGTGLLADALEACHAKQKVLRLDGSITMLQHQKNESSSQLWDLNLGLPKWTKPPTLLASSFVLHWLSDPKARLKEWFETLPPKGWLALALPIDGSFPEWQHAASQADVPYTALSFPSTSKLLQAIPSTSIRSKKIYRITESNKKVIALLRPMRQLGAHASHNKTMTIKEWRLLEKAWIRCNKDGEVKLTWCIQMLLMQR